LQGFGDSTRKVIEILKPTGLPSSPVMALWRHRREPVDERRARPQALIPEFKACAVQVFPAREDELANPEVVVQRGRY